MLVKREDNEGITTLWLNRPDKLNALNVPLFQDLETHINAITDDVENVGCVVLRGTGKCFSAGHDLGDIATGEKLPRPNYQSHVIEALAKLPQPVITAVHLHCFTGALELALAGDVIVCNESAGFGDTHAKFALTPIWGMSQRLPRRVGRSRAMDMMITARTVRGTEAAEIGLADYCFADDTFDADVAAYCQNVLENSWFSLRANKKLLDDTDGMSLDAGLAHEVYENQGIGPDMQDRVGGFLQK